MTTYSSASGLAAPVPADMHGKAVDAADSRPRFTANDRDRCATISHLPDLLRAMRPIERSAVRRILDVGCGYGGLTRFIREEFDAAEAHGIDIDSGTLAEARTKGVDARLCALGSDRLPYPDGHFELITALGMLDYLMTFDDAIRELHRVATVGGHVVVALPNLASWHNRLALLLGYQPRDVEVSAYGPFGVAPWHQGDGSTGHVHSVTVACFRELMEHHGFRTVAITSGQPRGRQRSRFATLVDTALSFTPTLSRRFFYVGVKQR